MKCSQILGFHFLKMAIVCATLHYIRLNIFHLFILNHQLSSKNQMTNFYPTDLLSLYSYNYCQCPSLAAAASTATQAKDWLKFSCFHSNLEEISAKYKLFKSPFKSLISSCDLQNHKYKSKSPAMLIEMAKKVTKQKQTNNDNSTSFLKAIKLDCEAKSCKILEKDSSNLSSHSMISNETNSNSTKEESGVTIPRNRKRKRSSGSSQSGQSAVTIKHHLTSALMRERSAFKLAIPTCKLNSKNWDKVMKI